VIAFLDHVQQNDNLHYCSCPIAVKMLAPRQKRGQQSVDKCFLEHFWEISKKGFQHVGFSDVIPGIVHPFSLYTEVFMSTLPSAPDALTLFAQCLKKVPDPRSKQGISHPCSTLLAVVLLGLLAKVSTPAEIARWTKRHFAKLSKFLRFGKIKGELTSSCDNTLTRVLKKLSLGNALFH
jgi:hypothetical protein